MEKCITITLDEYKALKYSQLLLSMLDAAGVDNWINYPDALYGDADGGGSFDDRWEKLSRDIDSFHK